MDRWVTEGTGFCGVNWMMCLRSEFLCCVRVSDSLVLLTYPVRTPSLEQRHWICGDLNTVSHPVNGHVCLLEGLRETSGGLEVHMVLAVDFLLRNLRIRIRISTERLSVCPLSNYPGIASEFNRLISQHMHRYSTCADPGKRKPPRSQYSACVAT